MRIACLQFDPRVGDVHNNLNRADAVLAKVDPADLDGLDLLVLPELAFTGYNFTSLHHIAPALEHAGTGISSLWAQNIALKHDCAVVVGYPEKVDVSASWPASPEYYNSALVYNGDGDVVGNYRKSFLYYTDETWALEGGAGFFKKEIPRLGNVALGICTDLNPYKLEAPWDAFEFGFHIQEAQSNLVIMSMAWQTHQHPLEFGRAPEEPDLDTLVYWVQRLEPIICANKEEEVVVVFCNRTGTEGEAAYTGTSAVIGIKRGQVFVYGVLGRGVNDVLVVDTSLPPRSKLTDVDAVEDENPVPSQPPAAVETITEPAPAIPTKTTPPKHEREIPCAIVTTFLDRPAALNSPLNSPRSPTSPKLPWLAQSTAPGGTPTDSRSPTRLQIPIRPQFDDFGTIDSAVTDDIAGSTRLPPRPKLPGSAGGGVAPASPWRFPGRGASPYPWHHHEGSLSAGVFGGGAAMTPITPFDEDGWSSTPIDPKGPPGWFWRHEPTLAALEEDVIEEVEEEEEEEGKGKEKEEEREVEGREKEVEREMEEKGKEAERRGKGKGREVVEEKHEVEMAQVRHETLHAHSLRRSLEHREVPVEPHRSFSFELDDQPTHQDEAIPDESFPDEEPEPAPLTRDWADLALVLEGLRARPSSSLECLASVDDRPMSTKSRNLSRNSSPLRFYQPAELDWDEWEDRHAPEASTSYGGFSREYDLPVRPRQHQALDEGRKRVASERPRRGRRRQSRLRHPVLFSEDPDTQPNSDYSDAEPEPEPEPEVEPPALPPRGRRVDHRAPVENPEADPAVDTPPPPITQEGPLPPSSSLTNTLPPLPPTPTTTTVPPSATATILTTIPPATYPPTVPLTLLRERESQRESQPSPLSVITSTSASTTTPSLCSGASATSAASISTFADHYHPHDHQRVDGEGGVGYEGKLGFETEATEFDGREGGGKAGEVFVDGYATELEGVVEGPPGKGAAVEDGRAVGCGRRAEEGSLLGETPKGVLVTGEGVEVTA